MIRQAGQHVGEPSPVAGRTRDFAAVAARPLISTFRLPRSRCLRQVAVKMGPHILVLQNAFRFELFQELMPELLVPGS